VVILAGWTKKRAAAARQFFWLLYSIFTWFVYFAPLPPVFYFEVELVVMVASPPQLAQQADVSPSPPKKQWL
jgi:hypothetical protein